MGARQLTQLGLVVGAGGAVALAAAAGTDGFLVPALVRARANWLPGPLQGASFSLPLNTVWIVLAVMTAAYALAVVSPPPLVWVLATTAALNALLWLAPPLFSTDVFNYVDVGRLQAHGLDPYAVTPAHARHLSGFVFLHWRHRVTVYGPLFTLLARAFGHLTVSAAVGAFKLVAALAAMACTALAAWIAQRRGHSPARAAAAFGLNPVVLVWTVGGAHNDLLMVLGLLAAVALLEAARPALAGAAGVAGAAVKLSAGLALPFLIAAAGPGRRLRAAAGALGAAAAIALLAYLAFPSHTLPMFGALRHQQTLDGLASLPTDAAYALGYPHIPPLEVHVLHAVLALWLVICAIAVLRGADALAVAGWALLGVVVTSTWLLPWYTVWPLALAAVTANRRLLVATSAVALSYAVGHVPLS